MKEKFKRLVVIFTIIMICFISKTYASGAYSLSVSKGKINKGESVILSISGSNAYGEVTITATNATVNPSSVFLQNDTKTVTITSNSNENIVITATPGAGGLGDIDENPITGSKSITINVNKPTTNTNNGSSSNNNSGSTGETTNNPTTPPAKSNNANLSNLGITPNDFSGFKAGKYSYNVEVPNETEKIEIYAKKGQDGQTISGTGSKVLQEGNNKFDIVVTAEDGKTKKTYTLNINRKAKEETTEIPQENENPEQPIEEIFGLSELKIDGFELEPQFQTDVYEYKLKVKEDTEKLDITPVPTEANTNIEITGNENLQEGENIITIIIKGENEEKTSAYQIIINKPIKENTIVQEDNKDNNYKKIILMIGIVILIIILILIIIKKRKSKGSDYIPYENIVNYDNNETETKSEDEKIEEIDYNKEESKKKKHSKGKRFK